MAAATVSEIPPGLGIFSGGGFAELFIRAWKLHARLKAASPSCGTFKLTRRFNLRARWSLLANKVGRNGPKIATLPCILVVSMRRSVSPVHSLLHPQLSCARGRAPTLQMSCLPPRTAKSPFAAAGQRTIFRNPPGALPRADFAAWITSIGLAVRPVTDLHLQSS